MRLQDIDHQGLQQILIELEQALHNHQQWHDNLVRILACRLPFDKHDAIVEPHKECRFGQWYYADKSKTIMENQGYIAIGEAHKKMHELARNILINLETNNNVQLFDYDNFSNSLEKLRLEIFAFRNELETLLYTRDPLTRTINRISLLPILREQREFLKRKQTQSICLVMIDLDLFKNVNDKYGHGIGDRVLAEVAYYISKNIRNYDKLFRYGGEEFLLCLQQMDLEKAYEVVEKLREGIAGLNIEVGLEKPIQISISCGLALLDKDAAVEESIDHADKALYMAKSAGRNCSRVWSAS